MSEVAIIGYGAIAVGFVVTAITMIAAVIAAVSKRARYRDAAIYGSYLTCALFGVASAAIIHGFMSHDFSLLYVHRYSDAAMPWIYQLAAFWGGQAGSLMFWAGALSLFIGAAVLFHHKSNAPLMPWFIAVTMGVLLFFAALLLFVSNPFETYALIQAPPDGQGLNPQLQTFTMVIHPPSLLLGYVSATIPFSFGMAALLSGRLDDDWLKATRKWTLISWAFLSIGLILGMLWAYTELGWGGYWAWDPVENAALIPWFVMTAYLHSAVIQEKRGMLKRWNLFLIILAFILTIFGTFLTRSGLIASVHSFAQSEIGDYFIVFMVTTAPVCLALLIYRWDELKSESRMESLLSREFVFLFNNWVLLFAAGIVLFGTMFPKLKEMVFNETASLGPPWFNKWMTPVALTMLVLTGVGMLISWRRASVRNFQKNFIAPLIAAGVATLLVPPAYYFYRIKPMGVVPDRVDVAYALFAVFFCSFVLAIVAIEFYRGARVRSRKLGIGFLTALTGLLTRNQRRYGGYIIHAGIVLLVFGFAGNAFRVEENVMMRVGEVASLGDYEVHLVKLREEPDVEKLKMFADIELLHDGEVVSELSPGRFFFYASQSPTSEVDIHSNPTEDVFFAVVNYDMESNTAALLMVINPFTMWLWIGGLLMVFGTMVCMWPQAQQVTVKSRKRKLAPATTVVGLFTLAVVPLSLVGFESAAQAGDEHAVAIESIDLVDPATQEIFDLIKCECEGCAGLSIGRCNPTCGEGRRDRALVVDLLASGRTREQVLQEFVNKRGEGAILTPKIEGFNHLTWIIPVIGAFVTVPLFFVVARRRRSQTVPPEPKTAKEGNGKAEEEDAVDDEGERLDDLERALEAME